ncbi:MAG TPA: hypothetical protein VGA37_12770 [Gemmatimonadales bacterium]
MVSKTWLATAALAFCAATASAQSGEDRCRDWNDRHWNDNDRERGWFCEVREVTIPANRDVLMVDGDLNGGIEVEAWDGNDIRIQARVFVRARTDGDAEEIAGEVEVRTDGTIRATGPRLGRRESWGVSYRISVPRSTNLDLRVHNGGISVAGVSGRVRFDALNGGVRLIDLSGDIRGSTTNGGLDIELTGRGWEGDGMDVRTTNGGVKITVPENYSAELETGTVNGGMRVDFPVTVQGRIGRSLSVTLGAGGKRIRAFTTNGGVVLRRI